MDIDQFYFLLQVIYFFMGWGGEVHDQRLREGSLGKGDCLTVCDLMPQMNTFSRDVWSRRLWIMFILNR